MANVTVVGGHGETVTIPFTNANNAVQAQHLLSGLTSFVDYTIGSPLPPANTTGAAVLIGPEIEDVLIMLPAGYTTAVNATLGPVSILGAGGIGQMILSGGGDLTYNTGGGTGTVITGDGNNLIGTPVSGNPSGSFSITTGTGNDTIIAATGANTVSAGAGNNFTFTGNGTDTVNSSGTDTISGVGGAAGSQDTVFQTSGTILIGSFAKNLLFVGSNAAATVLAGSGSYTVNGGQGANLIAGGTAGNNFLGGGTGSVGSTIFGGGNGDVILARGSGTNEVIAGAGNETLTGANSTGSNIFFTGLGANAGTAVDSITGGPGNDVYFAGSGQSTINLGAGGSDILAIVAGRAGGEVTLQNFNLSTDQVELQGYAPGTASAAIAQNVTLNGGTLLTLSDNTKIYFQGIGQVTTANIS